jgi:ADP-ribosylglycohydrolase
MRADRVEWRGFGAHNQPPGTWSDDGALMLALLDSLLSAGFDTTDQAQRAVDWYRDGSYAVEGNRFDIGNATREALRRVIAGIPAEEAGGDETALGNGSLMRILPLALVEREAPTAHLVEMAHRASKVTHGAHLTQVACALYTLVARRLVEGRSRKRSVLADACAELRRTYSSEASPSQYLVALNELEAWTGRSGRGHVADSFWSAWDAFLGADTYESAVKRAVAYGNDTDTTAAITGGLAGLLWGINGIPADWRAGMRDKRVVKRMVNRLVYPVRDKYRVYVIGLDERVGEKARFLKRNPGWRRGQPSVYVGQSCLTPNARFRRHRKAGVVSSDFHEFMTELRPELYKGEPVMYTRDDAEALEADLADRLRARGFGVWEGGRGPVKIKRKREGLAD